MVINGKKENMKHEDESAKAKVESCTSYKC